MLAAALRVFDKVQVIEVFDSKNWQEYEHTSNRTRFVMPVNANCRSTYQQFTGYCSDLDLYEWSKHNPEVIGQILEQLQHQEISRLIVWIEYPWLVGLTTNLKARLLQFTSINQVDIVYSSGNVEHEVYQDVLNSRSISGFDDLPQIVKEIEYEAVSNSSIVLCCSSDDKNKLQRLSDAYTIIAPNGVKRDQHDLSSIAASTLQHELSKFKYLFYAASDWAPNTDNINDFLGHNLGFIPPDCRLVVAGGVSRVFREIFLNDNSIHQILNASRLLVLDVLNEYDFIAAHALAFGYFLPVGYGGGTCLKTAEAIYTNRPIVASPAALRGYEAYEKRHEHVYRADNKLEFRAQISRILTDKTPQRRPLTGTKAESLESLTWESIVRDLSFTLSSIFKP